MDPLTIASLGISAAAGVAQGITGAIQKAKAKKMARNNKRPKYEVQQGLLDNEDLTNSEAAAGGISDYARQVYSTGAERGLTSSIDAILKGGGSVNNIANLYDNYQGGISKLALVAEEGRVRKIANVVASNNELAAATEKKFQINEFAPYADTAQAAAALSKQGSDNIWKGVGTIASTASSAAMSRRPEAFLKLQVEPVQVNLL